MTITCFSSAERRPRERKWGPDRVIGAPSDSNTVASWSDLTKPGQGGPKLLRSKRWKELRALPAQQNGFLVGAFIPAPGHACLKAWLDDFTPLNVELIFVGVDLRRRTREQRRNFCAALTSHLGKAHDELRDDIHGWRLRSLRPRSGGSAFGFLCPSRLVMLWLIAPAQPQPS